jgi:hypothetical protein
VDDEQKLYGLMTIVEEQQKNIDTTLKNIQATATAVAKERVALAETVKNISAAVGKSAADALFSALGEARERFNGEMDQTTSQALKSAQEANKELDKAKKTVDSFTHDMEGKLRREISRACLWLIAIFTVIGLLSSGGIYWYALQKVNDAQQRANYWTIISTNAYAKCQKLKSCRQEIQD